MGMNKDTFNTFRFQIVSDKLLDLIDELGLVDVLGADFRGSRTLLFAPSRKSYTGTLETPLQCGNLSLPEQASVITWLAHIIEAHFADVIDPPRLAWALNALRDHRAELDADIEQATFVNTHYAFDGTSSIFIEHRQGTRITTYTCPFAAYRAAQPDPLETDEAAFHAFAYRSIFVLLHDIPKIPEVVWALYSTTALSDPAGPPLTVPAS